MAENNNNQGNEQQQPKNGGERPQMAEPMGGDRRAGLGGAMREAAAFEMVGSESGVLALPAPSNLPATARDAGSLMGQIITAQAVAVKRDPAAILRTLAVLSATFGEKYVYSWSVNDKRSGGKTTIEGPTIKLANDLVRTYGNCAVDVRAMPGPTHTIFYARFVDLETGFSLTRAFMQRNAQSADFGRMDAQRAQDIVFQIGQSKAIRNVVVNALSGYAEFMVEESKRGVVEWIAKNLERTHKYIDDATAKFGIDMKRIEATLGKTREKWLVRDLARVMTELRGISDGLTDPEDVYPLSGNKADGGQSHSDNQGAGGQGDAPAPTTRRKRGGPAPAATAAGGTTTGDAGQNGGDPKPAENTVNPPAAGTNKNLFAGKEE